MTFNIKLKLFTFSGTTKRSLVTTWKYSATACAIWFKMLRKYKICRTLFIFTHCCYLHSLTPYNRREESYDYYRVFWRCIATQLMLLSETEVVGGVPFFMQELKAYNVIKYGTWIKSLKNKVNEEVYCSIKPLIFTETGFL